MTLSLFAITQLEQALNGLLALDPETSARVRAVNGQIVLLKMANTELAVFLTSHDGRLHTLTETDQKPAAILTGSPSAFMHIGLASICGKPSPDAQIEIAGNQETGRAFLTIMEKLSIDWEEQLSRLTGDIVAHQAGHAARRTAQSVDNMRVTLHSNLSEYLQEELRVLPTRIEISNLSADITDVESRMQRLEERLRQLGKIA